MRWIIRIGLGLVAILAIAAGAVFWSVWSNPLRPGRVVGIEQAVAADPGHAPVGVLDYYPALGKA